MIFNKNKKQSDDDNRKKPFQKKPIHKRHNQNQKNQSKDSKKVSNLESSIKSILDFSKKTPQKSKKVELRKSARGSRKSRLDDHLASLEPRDMQKFIMKRKSLSRRHFPYMTPKQAYLKYNPFHHHRVNKKTPKGVLRVIPLGGQEQVGLNCILFEYNNEVLVVDMGLQFPDDHMFGVSSRIPDISYLRGKKVIGVFITHGHIDHIGAVPYLMRMIGSHVPIYSAKMALELIKLKNDEFKLPLKLEEIKVNQVKRIGSNFYIEPFTVDHSIPDSMGVRIHTPVGKFIHTGDWKFDQDPRPGAKTTDHDLLKKFGKEGVRALMSDSTNAHMSGSSMADKVVIEPLEEIFRQSHGRIITGTFSSIIDRLQIIVDTAEKFHRKVAFLGRGMLNYVEIAKKLGYLKHKKDTLIDISEINDYPDSKVCVCCTGAQGERYAALMRIATGESRDVEFKKGDTVILSSSIIPGNERKVQELMDLLEEEKVKIHHYRQSNIHSGGHAREEDVKQMITEIKPNVFIPIYGHRFMIHANAKIAEDLKVPKILKPRNGQVIEFHKDREVLTNDFTSNRFMTVDGCLIGFTGEKEFMERYQMSKAGVVVVNILSVKNDVKIHLISHGSVDLSLLPELKNEIISAIKKEYIEAKKAKIKRDQVNRTIRKKLQSLFWNRLSVEPVIIIAS